MGLSCHTKDLCCDMRDLLLWGVDSLVVVNVLSSCGSQAPELWDQLFAAHRLSCPVAWGILASKSGIESMSPALQGRFLTTGPPGKSSWLLFLIYRWINRSIETFSTSPMFNRKWQSWDFNPSNLITVFVGRTDVEAETPILWPPDPKSWLIWKDPDAGKDWRQEKKGTTEDEMVGWHHRLNGHEFEWTPGVGDGQGGLAYCSPWGHKESDTTERLNWTEYICFSVILPNHLTNVCVGQAVRVSFNSCPMDLCQSDYPSPALAGALLVKTKSYFLPVKLVSLKPTRPWGRLVVSEPRPSRGT